MEFVLSANSKCNTPTGPCYTKSIYTHARLGLQRICFIMKITERDILRLTCNCVSFCENVTLNLHQMCVRCISALVGQWS